MTVQPAVATGVLTASLHRGRCRAGSGLSPGSAREIPLYPGPAPGSEKWDWRSGPSRRPTACRWCRTSCRPVLLHYPADRDRSVGTAMIVAPGGGFRALMMSYEGVDIARRLNAMGVDAFVLKYRLLYTGPDAPRSRARPSGERPRDDSP